MSTLNIVTYSIVGLLLLLSFFKSKEKTKKALKVAWKSFKGMAPGLFLLVGFVGITLGFITTDMISRVLGESAGIWGTLLAAAIGGTVLMPAFIAFPLGGTLLKAGSTVQTVTAFVSATVMVGVATLPVESKAFGKKFAIVRNSLSFLLALLLASLMGVIL
ncbi:MAG: permease [Eubacteriales bacterium]|nr:permease [Eubacteriales bacterium]MDD4323216.1 permease [Eubacteriales bacterium]MDD4542089.1 permease [Eubacteriales bacterium]